MAKTIHRGCEYYCTHPKLPHAAICVVIAITDERGKSVGVQLSEKQSFANDLDGRCEKGYGLWVLPDHLLTTEEYRQQLERQQSIQSIKPSEFENITVDDDSPAQLKFG